MFRRAGSWAIEIAVALGLVAALFGGQYLRGQEPTPQPPAPSPTPAAVISIAAPAFTPANQLVRVSLKDYTPVEKDVIVWDIICGSKILDETQIYSKGDLLLFTGEASKNPYRIRVALVREGKIQAAALDVMIGDKLPDPPSPNPVDPPAPPTPVVGKVRILFLTEELGGSQPVKNVINSVELRAWLDSHCFIAADGRPEYRVWDDDYTDEQVSKAHGQKWLDAYKLAKAERSKAGKGDNDDWVLISNGTDGESLPTPIPLDKTLEALKKWGGN